MTKKLTPARYIRLHVFGFPTQEAFAEALGFTQAHISRFESGHPFSSEAQERIRDLARELGVHWDNNLFFELPRSADNGSAVVEPSRSPEVAA